MEIKVALVWVDQLETFHVLLYKASGCLGWEIEVALLWVDELDAFNV